MVAGASRMAIANIKKQPIDQRKRKCTRADPTQTGILLKYYDAEARPSTEQFVDMSQQTNLSVDWIKKWFLRRRKADGKNKTLVPPEPTFVKNEPPAHGGQTLGHAHSKFWSMEGFAAADPTSFSPSVGHIPKFYGHHRHSLPLGNADDDATDSQGNEEERAILSSGTSTEADYGYVTRSDPVLTGGNAEAITPANYDVREVLLGADAFAGYGSASESPASEHSDIALIIDEFLSVFPSPERSTYLDNHFDERLSHSESTASFELSMTNHPVPLISSPIGTIDDFILASGDLDFNSTTSCSTSDDLELSAFDPVTGCTDSDLGSLPGFANLPSYMTSILGESSAFHESLLFLGGRDEMGDSVDVCLGAGADHLVFMLTEFGIR